MTPHLLGEGQKIGDRYEVLAFLDEGGMQQVFTAWDHAFGRAVALKVPKNRSAERRFERSARMSAKVTHPNVAKTLDYFELDGQGYLVEELIDGRDLAKGLRADYAFLDPHLAAFLFHRLARGLAAAHHAGVFHRDLKPSNVMVCNGPGLTFVRITDFGVAKMAETEIGLAVQGGLDGDESSFVSSSTAVGALPFMAPELITAPKEAGMAADVWAVGAMLAYTLSGNLPFGQGLVAVPRILEGPLPPLPAILNNKGQFSRLGRELWAVMEACLDRRPDARPTADQLVQMCSNLCYADSRRRTGVIRTVRPGNGRWGDIDCEDGSTVFYHEASYYGAAPKPDQRVAFASFPGSPRPRAHPVLPLKPI